MTPKTLEVVHLKLKASINVLKVKWAEQQEILRRYKREAIPTDPEFQNMWYLVCALTQNFINTRIVGNL